MGVTFEKVTKVYPGGGRPAVKDLSLEVQDGELMVFIGPSGCGKTTTLRMINRLEEPTNGTIAVNGRDIESYDPVQLRRGIGYAIQQTGLLPHKTIVFVTHDMDEAIRLGDRIGIFREGELHQVGTPDELVDTPKDEFVAKFIGHFLGPKKAPVDSVRQFMETADVRIQREIPGRG